MNYLNNLEEEFMKLKQDALKLQQMNQQMHNNIVQIESTYISKRTISHWIFG